MNDVEQTTAPTSQAASQQAAMGDMAQQASPQEQEQYTRFVSAAMNMVYSREALPKILGILGGEGDPVEGLSRASAMVISRVAKVAENAGQKLPGDVVFHAGREVFEDLAELSREAKIKDFSKDQDAFEGAYFRTMDQVRVLMQGAGQTDPQAAQQDMAKLEEMDANGELERLLTGLNKRDQEQQVAPVKKAPGGLMRGAA